MFNLVPLVSSPMVGFVECTSSMKDQSPCLICGFGGFPVVRVKDHTPSMTDP